MPVVSIHPSQWSSFCQRFTRQHRGGHVSLEVLQPDGTVQRLASERPLKSISVDDPAGHPAAIVIALGNEPDEQLTHVVSGARRLCAHITRDGAQLGLGIESDDGLATRLRFRVPVRIEALDGLVT